MSRHPLEANNALHAETAHGNYAPANTDYPMRLLTRRTLSESAAEIVRAREHAPGALRAGALSGRRRPV